MLDYHDCGHAQVCYVQPMRDMYVEPARETYVESKLALLWRFPLPPYAEIRSSMGIFHLGKPLFFMKRPTLRAWLTPSFTLVLSPDENGGGLALKYRF